MRVIISGGGTGGHIFPAISIANQIKLIDPEASILFIGAEDRMEMQRVPKAGYDIKGLPIAGFNRKHLWKNIPIAFKLLKSLMKAKKIIKQFKPDVVVGVGGFASGPTLKMAARLGIPTLIQEQNSYAGVTNKLLAKKAKLICTAYPNMERFFPAGKIKLTGNPVRQELFTHKYTKETVAKEFNLSADKPIVLILGGSLGAKSINEAILYHYDNMANSNIQYIWQTGSLYKSQIEEQLTSKKKASNIIITDFITDMSKAYAAADLVVSRSGAGSISEFCLLGKAVILIPSPNVAEDHQTKNAQALVDKGAAIMIKDNQVKELLLDTIIKTIENPAERANLEKNILTLALPNSAEIIAMEVIRLANKR